MKSLNSQKQVLRCGVLFTNKVDVRLTELFLPKVHTIIQCRASVYYNQTVHVKAAVMVADSDDPVLKTVHNLTMREWKLLPVYNT